jgi:hypothetical protein
VSRELPQGVEAGLKGRPSPWRRRNPARRRHWLSPRPRHPLEQESAEFALRAAHEPRLVGEQLDAAVAILRVDRAGGPAGSFNILAALITGDVDAAFGAQQLLDLEQKGTVRIIYSTRNDSPAFTSNSAFFVADAFERQNPEITYRVVKALVKAAAWASDEANREAVFETWALSGVPAAIYRAEFEGQTVKYRNSPLIDGFLVNFYKEQVVASRQLGYIRHDVDVDRWIEPKYLQRALAELNLEHYWDAYDTDGTVGGAKIRPPAAP